MSDDEVYPAAPAHVHERVQNVLHMRGRYANVIGDQLAEDFFDEKIAPYLRGKGMSPEAIARQRPVFSKMVIEARAELRNYYR